MQRAIIILWGCLFTPCLATGSEDGWIDLIGEGGLEGWRKPVHAWVDATDAKLDPGNDRRLTATLRP